VIARTGWVQGRVGCVLARTVRANGRCVQPRTLRFALLRFAAKTYATLSSCCIQVRRLPFRNWLPQNYPCKQTANSGQQAHVDDYGDEQNERRNINKAVQCISGVCVPRRTNQARTHLHGSCIPSAATRHDHHRYDQPNPNNSSNNGLAPGIQTFDWHIVFASHNATVEKRLFPSLIQETP